MTATDLDLWGRLRTGDWLDAQEFPPLSYAVPGIIPEGLGILAGPPKAGKSWLALGVLLDVAAGGLALGAVPVGDGRPVFYLALEDGDRRMQSRARVLLGEDIPIPARFSYITRVLPPEVPDLIREWLEFHGTSRPLVVLDTLGKVLRSTRPGEGAYERDYAVVGALKAVADDFPGSTVLLVHHTRKAPSEDFMDSVSGTNGMNGAADFSLVLSRRRHDDSGTLQVSGRDVHESEFALSSEGNRWVLTGGSADAAARAAEAARVTAGVGDRMAQVVDFVTSRGGPVSVKEVEVGLEFPEARRYLARAVEAGRLDRAGRGLYVAVPTVPSDPSAGHGVDGLGQPAGRGVPNDDDPPLLWDNGTVGTPARGDS